MQKMQSSLNPPFPTQKYLVRKFYFSVHVVQIDMHYSSLTDFSSSVFSLQWYASWDCFCNKCLYIWLCSHILIAITRSIPWLNVHTLGLICITFVLDYGERSPRFQGLSLQNSVYLLLELRCHVRSYNKREEDKQVTQSLQSPCSRTCQSVTQNRRACITHSQPKSYSHPQPPPHTVTHTQRDVRDTDAW